MLSKEDVRNLVLLLFGMLLVLVLVPPARLFPITDDWTYAQSVTDLLNWSYKTHDFSQATALTHVAWGALFSLILGQSFTVLAFANLVMSGICMIVFYLLLRQIQVTATNALFGTAVLTCNPLYIYLSYSFMTDITFITCMLAACLCYVRGMQGYAQGEDRISWPWLLAGSLIASLAYLTRQFGLLLLPAALGYLWWSRRWTWRRAAAIAAIPLALCFIYLLWDRTHPVRLADIFVNGHIQSWVSDPPGYVVRRALLVAGVLPILGLLLLPIIRFPRRPLRALPCITLILLLQIRALQETGSMMPQNGNLVGHTGSLMFLYDAAPIWTEAVWAVLGTVGGVLISIHLTAYGEAIFKWLRSRSWRHRSEEPIMILFLLAIMLSSVTLIAAYTLFDRYLVPILPLLIVVELRRLSASNNVVRLPMRWILALPVAVFALVGQRDYMAHAAARWQAAQQPISQGARHEQVDAGYEWGGWYSYEAGAEYIRETGDYRTVSYPPFAVLDPLFRVADRQHEGYTEIGSVSYESWLNGGEPRRVLLLKRN